MPVDCCLVAVLPDQQVNTNILNVDMAALGNAAPFATGDPSFCRGCGACLSAVSILRPLGGIDVTAAGAARGTRHRPPLDRVHGTEDPGVGIRNPTSGSVAKAPAMVVSHEGFEGSYEWICEFCCTVGKVDLDDMEKPMPGQESVDYVLEAPPVSAAVPKDAGLGEDAPSSGVRDGSARWACVRSCITYGVTILSFPLMVVVPGSEGTQVMIQF